MVRKGNRGRDCWQMFHFGELTSGEYENARQHIDPGKDKGARFVC